MTVKGSGAAAPPGADPEKVPPDEVHRYSNEFRLRPSWVDARLALQQVNKGHADGSRAALWLRARTQWYLFHTGRVVQRHAGKIMFAGILLLATLCIGLKNIHLHTNVEELWVEEGGRLQRELEYVRSSVGAGAGSLSQIIVQTPRSGWALRPEPLLAHLAAVRAASQVSVDLYDITWGLKDLCYKPSFPMYEEQFVDNIMERLIPCSFVTPLDCFWEGAKLLGPDFPITLPHMPERLLWTNLDPERVFNMMNRQFGPSFQFPALQNYMKRAGITSGYQRRPCLDPADPECPDTAANKASGLPPDIGAELTGGCYGFATKYMHWPEELIVGGIEKNRTGHIVRARALQTVIQLMGEKNLYDYWLDNWKTHNMDWTVAKARAVLDAWQAKFSEELKRHVQAQDQASEIQSYSMESLNQVLEHLASFDVVRVGIGYGLMLVYGFFSLVRWSDPVRSQGGLGVAGVLLVTLSVTAGLGLCGLCGIPFNASTTQVIPFLALGLGVDDMFLMTLTYSEIDFGHTPVQDQVGELLQRAGVSVLVTSVCNIMAFVSAAILPIPALRYFSLQAGVLVAFNVISILLIFPAMLSLDLRRRRARMYDVICCWSETEEAAPPPAAGAASAAAEAAAAGSPPAAPRRHAAVSRSAPGGQVVTSLSQAAPPAVSQSAESLDSVASTRTLVRERFTPEGEASPAAATAVFCPRGRRADCRRVGLRHFVQRYYADLVVRRPFRVLVLLTSVAAVGVAAYGAAQVQDGMDLTDIVPRGSDEYAFLDAQRRYFGFFEMAVVTQGGFEYPTNQRLLHEYHQAFIRVPHIIKNDDGGLPDFWLSMFRDWLLDLQRAFDRDWAAQLINREQWSSNASEEGVLAFKLLVQTGRVEYPIDKSQLPHVRLVEDGIINPKGFYNYLTAWASNDALAYSASRAQLRPEPKQWYHAAGDVELKIPKSQSLVFAQAPFALSGLSATDDIVATIEHVRAICRRFEERGLPNFPHGVPFTFWEQYLTLRAHLLLALGCVLVAVFAVVSVTLMNVWAAAVVVTVSGVTTLQLFGAMGLMGLRLSAVPAVILIMSVGIGVEFSVHILLGFLTSLGTRAARVQRSLEHMFAPVFHGSLSTLLGVLMLAFSDFDFIIRYFFCVLAALVLLGLVNGLALLPVLLCWLGPPAEVRPAGGGALLPAPSPQPSPPRVRGPRVYRSSSLTKSVVGGGGGGKRLQHAPSRLSLSTISEESQSSQSSGCCSAAAAVGGGGGTPGETRTHDIVVEPQVTVQTSYPGGDAAGEHARAHPLITTKVTATTHVKVEVHAPAAPPPPCDAGSHRQSRRARAARPHSPVCRN